MTIRYDAFRVCLFKAQALSGARERVLPVNLCLREFYISIMQVARPRHGPSNLNDHAW